VTALLLDYLIKISRKTLTTAAGKAAKSRYFIIAKFVDLYKCGEVGWGDKLPMVWQMVKNIKNQFCCTSYAITIIYNEQTTYLKIMVCKGVTLCSLVYKYIDMTLRN
jgi:hypothetical protein